MTNQTRFKSRKVSRTRTKIEIHGPTMPRFTGIQIQPQGERDEAVAKARTKRKKQRVHKSRNQRQKRNT